MPTGQDHAYRRPYQRLRVEPGIIQRLRRKSHVELPVRDPVADVLALADLDGEAKTGVAGAERPQRQLQQAMGEMRLRKDAQRYIAPLADVARRRFDFGEGGKDALAFAVKAQALRRRQEPPALAPEERKADRRLELRDQAAHDRLRAVHALRRRRDRAFVDNDPQGNERFRIKAHKDSFPTIRKRSLPWGSLSTKA